MDRSCSLAVALIALAALAVPAHAFTREAGPTDSTGNARFADPDEKLEQRFQPSPSGNGGALNLGNGFSFTIQSNERPRGAIPGDPLYRR